MKSLYHIEKEYLDIASQLEESEVTPELEAALQINANELQGKAIAYARVIKDSDATIYAIDEEIARLTALKKAEKNKAERLKDVISNAMQFHGITEVKSDLLKLSFRKSEKVVGMSFDDLPDAYLTIVPESRKPNLTAIKAGLKEGKVIGDYRIEENQNLQIK